MKSKLAVMLFAFAICLGVYHFKATAADVRGFQIYEFATIRWDGRENTHLIRPNGKIELLGPILNRVQRPDRTDERSFYMNVAMNAIANEGFEFAGMTADAIVMKRSIPK